VEARAVSVAAVVVAELEQLEGRAVTEAMAWL
jgi:hypothetical protein